MVELLGKAAIAVLAIAAGIYAQRYFHSDRNTSPVREAEVDEVELERVIRELEDGAPEFSDEDDENEVELEGDDLEHGAQDAEAHPHGPVENRAAAALQAAQAAAADQPQARPARWKTRETVGTKKAKSLARKEQRRAYFEYVRDRAESERAQEKAAEDMFGDLIEEERLEREQRIEAARKKLIDARIAKAAREKAAQEKLEARQADIKAILSRGQAVEMRDANDVSIAQSIDDSILVANNQWLVLPDRSHTDRIATRLQASGRVSFEELRQNWSA